MRKNRLFVLALILIPFEAVPYIFPTTYRPISFIFLLPILFLIILRTIYKLKLEKTVFYLLLAFIYFSTVSLLITHYYDFQLDGFFDYFVTFAVGLSAFTVFRYKFGEIKQNTDSNDEFVKVIFKYLAIGYVILVVIGIVEFLSFYTPILPVELKKSINFIIGGKTSSRLQLTSSEPGWAARQALFGLPILFITKGKRSFWTIGLFLLFLFTFSLEGIVVLVLSSALYFAYLFWDRKYILFKKYIKMSISLILLISLIIFSAQNFFLNKNSYYYSRFKKFSKIDFSKISYSKAIYVEESVFIRIAYPIIGFLIFIDHPITGVGGGNFRYHFSDYVKEEFPLALKLNYTQVEQQVRGKKDQSKNFYARVMAEFGVMGILLFSIFLRVIIKRLRNSEFTNPDTKKYLVLWLIICLVSLLQFDSLAYLNFWLMSAFILSLGTLTTVKIES